MITRVMTLNVADSTQTLAKTMADEGEAGGLLIIAQRQTSGRGQFERKWDSGAGGLYFSLILRPEKSVVHSSAFTIKMAEVVVETLEKLFNINAKVKFPNDVLVYNPRAEKWQKICGILTETSTTAGRTEWVVVGVGINLNNDVDKKMDAASVKKITGKPVDMEMFKQEFFAALSRRYYQWLKSVQI